MQTNGFPRALHELEQEFARLASEIPDGAQKQALSVLHGIVMEVWPSIGELQWALSRSGVR
jgi:hypothetical protein